MHRQHAQALSYFCEKQYCEWGEMSLTGGMNCADVTDSKAANKRKTQGPIFKRFHPSSFSQRRFHYMKFTAEAATVYLAPASSLLSYR